MEIRYVDSEETFIAACKEMEAKGFRLAAVSNAGLTGDKRRLTFLPASAFTDSKPESN